jgi:hypothetical protein
MSKVNEIDRSRISVDLIDKRRKDACKIIGAFKCKSWKGASVGYLYKLEPDDPIFLSNTNEIKVKDGQQLFRYETRVMFGQYMPVVAINTKMKNPSVYFLTEDSFDGKNPNVEFEKKGIPIDYMWIFEDSKHLFN